MITVPNRAVWIGTGNNPRLSRELTRRTIRCRLDTGSAEPWRRSEFRHSNLLEWIRQNRPQLIHALLTLVQAWVAEGQPRFTGQTLGSFESYAEVVGGVLEVAGISGFLGNLDDLYAEADAEGDEWRELTEAWWTTYKSRAVRPRDLVAICARHDLMGLVRGAGLGHSQLTRLGNALLAARDTVYGRFRIRQARDDGAHHGKKYQLVPIIHIADEADFELAGPHAESDAGIEGYDVEGDGSQQGPHSGPHQETIGK